jgi:hypothetical protein
VIVEDAMINSYICPMTIKEAFNHLCTNWKKQPDHLQKHNVFISRFRNRSGKQTKKVSEKKMIEILEDAGYRVDIKINVKLPKKK